MKKAVISILEVMNHSATEKAGTIAARRALQVELRGHSRIQCTGGKLWLTRSGDPNDHILVEGESFRLDAPARLLLSGLGEASYRIV